MTPRTGLLVLAAIAVPVIAHAQGAPTAQQLGVPVYPGATYDPRMSAGLSQEREKYYVFTTTDPMERVITFYENATHKRGTVVSEGEIRAVMIAIQGSPPFPEHGVSIENNRPGMYPPAIRTVISVRRMLPEEQEQQ